MSSIGKGFGLVLGGFLALVFIFFAVIFLIVVLA